MIYITKYFSQAALRPILDGSIKISSLSKLRYIEGNPISSAAMSDDGEGEIWNSYDSSTNVIRSGILGSSIIKNSHIEHKGYGAPIGHRAYKNSFIYCAADGPYSSRAHNNMKNGIDNYAGNSDYTHAVQYDLKKFLKILYPKVQNYKAAKVQYGDRSTNHHAGENVRVPIHSSSASVNKAVFIKPNRFAAENEFRIEIDIAPPAEGREERFLYGFHESIVGCVKEFKE